MAWSVARKRLILVIAGACVLLLASAVWMITTRCGARWDTAIGRPGFDEPVRALALFDGALIAGGMFLEVAGQPASRLAQWDGRRWAGISARVPVGPVRAMHIFDDGRGEALFIAGQSPHVVRWDGLNWSIVGEGFDDWVMALATFDDGQGEELYAAGRFNSVAKWNGRSWIQLGERFDGSVHALAVFNGSLHAGGAFTGGVALWDGGEWTVIGEGLDGYTNTMAVGRSGDRDALFTGGRFTRAGGITANNLAMWDGSSWHTLGDGVNGEVQSMALAHSEEAATSLLYVGGAFTQAGEVAASRIARWDGERFAALGRGADERVQALLAVGQDERGRITLHAGGIFEHVNGREANCIATWRECVN